MAQEVTTIKQNESDLDVKAKAEKLFETGLMLLHGKKKDIDRAIKCTQRAISLHNSDYRYWQFLGDAYYQRGNLNPAINCFIRSIVLIEEADSNKQSQSIQSELLYSRTRVSDVRFSIGNHEAAIEGYNDILLNCPNDTATLYGAARAQIQLAKQDFSEREMLSGHNHCLDAFKLSIKVILSRPDFCLGWKLASDCCLISVIYGPREKPSDSSIVIEDLGDKISFDKSSCLEFADQLLCKSLTFEAFKESSCLWHNLGITLALKSISEPNQESEKITLLQAFKCLLKALDFDRQSSQIKNSLGVVAAFMGVPRLAHHFFVSSIKSNFSTSEVQYLNLALLYYSYGDKINSKLLSLRAQSEEPLYRCMLFKLIYN